MSALDVFEDPELSEVHYRASEQVLKPLTGLTHDVALAALFSIFIGIAKHGNRNAGYEFELMLSTIEARSARTHDGNSTIN